MCGMVAPLIGLPVRRIRVVKPRIGGGFGASRRCCWKTCART